MGFASRLTTRLFGESNGNDDRQVFRCWKCDTTFESDAETTTDARCPSCGNADAPWLSLAGD